MSFIESIRSIVEKQVFGVCTWLGDKLGISTTVIRLFFIYATFLTVASPLIVYLILAFWLKMKNYLFNRRSSVWEL